MGGRATLLLLMTLLGVPMLTADERAPVVSALHDAAERHARGDWLGAAADWERARGLAPGDFEAAVGACHGANDLGQMAAGPEAERHFARAVQLSEGLRQAFSERPEAHFWLAVSYGNLALFKGGKDKVRLSRGVEAAARRALALDARFAGAHVVLGVYAHEVADLNWFLRTFAKTFLGGLPRGTFADARTHLEQALALQPEDAFAWARLGLTCERLGDRPAARVAYERARAAPLREPRDVAAQADAAARLARWR